MQRHVYAHTYTSYSKKGEHTHPHTQMHSHIHSHMNTLQCKESYDKQKCTSATTDHYVHGHTPVNEMYAHTYALYICDYKVRQELDTLHTWCCTIPQPFQWVHTQYCVCTMCTCILCEHGTHVASATVNGLNPTRLQNSRAWQTPNKE